MTTSHSRNRIGVLLAVSVGILGASLANASDANKPGGECRQEVQRVAVWPKGGNPKAAQVPRYENREVTICNGKVVSQKSPQDAAKTEPG